MAADARPCALTIESEEVRLNTVNQDQGTADAVVEAQSEARRVTVAFNPQYLTDGVEAAVGEGRPRHAGRAQAGPSSARSTGRTTCTS
jgi:hypothetical protein